MTNAAKLAALKSCKSQHKPITVGAPDTHGKRRPLQAAFFYGIMVQVKRPAYQRPSLRTAGPHWKVALS